jgi:thymidylate synthase (FAD)
MTRVINQSAELKRHDTNPEKWIEYAGRLSTHTTDKITRGSYVDFVKNLLKPKNGGDPHKSVLEHVTASFEITTSVAIAAQFRTHRHRMGDVEFDNNFGFTQQSLRYCNLTKDKFGNEITVIKPMHLEAGTLEYNEWIILMNHCEQAYFKEIKKCGFRPEQARNSLPMCMATKFMVSCNFSQWMHYLKMRLALNAQDEHRYLAGLIRDKLVLIAPIVFGEFSVKEVG